MQREKFGSRLGFLLISAGCAIGLGNVYRFPIITGTYGGGFFVLIYLLFLILLGLPAMTAELSVGRASQRSIASSFEALEKPGQKWHWMKYLGISGNYLLMMFYTIISGWMIIYFIQYLTGSIFDVTIGITDTAVAAEQLSAHFGSIVTNLPLVFCTTLAVIVICFGICSLGLQQGVEKITKIMMVVLFALMLALGIYCCTLDGALDGIRFYLVPSLTKLKEAGIGTVVSAAMGQAFFTLSVGIGSIAIFGSYINKDRRLLGEAATIISLDTSVALLSGFIVFPACFTFNGGQTADAGSVGASFLFTTLSGIFNAMPFGRIIGTLFFLFMIFAAFSTVIAVFENITSFWLELTKMNRKTIAAVNIVLMILLTLPAILGFSVWDFVQIGGKGIMDLEDFIISNNLLPLGALAYIVFCSYNKIGWGWSNFITEANTGDKGPKFPSWMRVYVKYILPLIILIVWLSAYLPIL